MKIKKTYIEGLLLLETDQFDDVRGYLSKFYDSVFFKRNDLNFELTQVKYTFTKKRGTIRGLHMQKKPYEEDKIVRCMRGKIFEVAVDLRKGSKTYGKWFGKVFSDRGNESFYLPKGFAHGHQSLTDNTELLYLMSGKFSGPSNIGYLWNDPAFNIKWKLKPTVMADKDRKWPLFKK